MAVLFSISTCQLSVTVFTIAVCLTLSQFAALTQGQAAADSSDLKELTLMLITSFGRFGYNSSGTLPAADIALEGINNRTDILPGYKLVYDIARDSECEAAISLDRFFEGVHPSEPVKIGVIGCGCSVATEPVAAIIHHWNIPLISYGTTSSSLSNTTIYRNYFRANPPSTSLTPALSAISRQFEWKRIGLLTQDENRFRRVESSIRDTLASVGIQVGSHNYMTVEDPTKVDDIFLTSEDYRVFLLNSYPDARIICEAFKMGLVYPKYTWIAYGWYAQASWTNGYTVNCTEDQLRMVLENGISVEVFPIPDDTSARTVSELTPADFNQEYKMRARMSGYEILETTAAQLHDDIWALALALNATMTMIDPNNKEILAKTGCDSEGYPGNFVPLEEFMYNNTKMGCLFAWNLRQTNFTGVSGAVFFNESLIDHTVTLLQYKVDGNDLIRQRFATVDKATNYSFQYDESFSDEKLFPDGVPSDGIPIARLRSIVLPLIVIVDVLATIGMVFAVSCLVFNVTFRERKVVKLTSPRLNYFIIFGAFFMYCSVYFYVIPKSNVTRGIAQASCFIREWFFTIGYTLAYGALLAKLWRVYTIFNNPAPNKKIFKDWQLIILTLTVTGIATFLLFLGSSIPPLRGKLSETPDSEFGHGISKQDVRINYYVLVCYKDVGSPLYWRIFMFAYLAVLQILGIMLAFQTRRVKVKSLRDSTFVTVNIYISSIVIVIFILATFALRTYANAYSAIFSTGILVLTSTFLALTFIPKMLLLYKDPNGESVEESMSRIQNSQLTSSNPVKNDSGELEERIASLEIKLKEKEDTIDKMKTEIETSRKRQVLSTVLE